MNQRRVKAYDAVVPIIQEVIEEVFGMSFGTLIDDAYQRATGFDMNTKNLWRYRSIHAQSVKIFLCKMAKDKLGKPAFQVGQLENQTRVYVGAIWAIAEAPLCLQGVTRTLRNLAVATGREKPPSITLQVREEYREVQNYLHVYLQ